MRRTLAVSNEYMSGTVEMEKRDNVWRVLGWSEQLAWVKQVKMDDLKVELLRRGFKWEWL